jgi:AAA+ superfamily predicted ATPase
MAETKGAIAAADVAALIRAKMPLLWVQTREEPRAERLCAAAANGVGYPVRFWDCSSGLTRAGSGSPFGDGSSADPAQVLQTIREDQSRCVYILRDFAGFLKDPFVCRAMRNLCRTLEVAPRDNARCMILLAPAGEVPPELADHATVIDWPLPDKAELASTLKTCISALPDELQATAAPNGVWEKAIDAAVGLSEAEASACYKRSLVDLRRIEPVRVAQEKKRVIAREKVLEWFDPLPGGLDDVGGLEILKAWILERREAFSERARRYGLPAPKGILAVGVQGCGKSLMAKATATALGVPLLRLDMGALRSKFVGESEGNIRKALRVAETVAPCVLWLDEIEKAMAGASQGAADGGVSADALGVVLTWMQERAGDVFVFATSNDVSALPPELLRKGRFDELFFVDTPTKRERVAILRAALRQFKRPAAISPVELESIAEACAGFIGAEVAQLIPDALYRAFADSARELKAQDLMDCASKTVPLTKTAAEKVGRLREWAKGRARPASEPETTTGSGVARLEL